MFSIYLHYCFFQPFVFYPNKCINFVMVINMLHLLYFHNVNNDHVKGAHFMYHRIMIRHSQLQGINFVFLMTVKK